MAHLCRSVLLVAMLAAVVCLGSPRTAKAVGPTPTTFVNENVENFAAGNVKGTVGYLGGKGQTVTSGNGTVWADFGSDVQGSQCPSATDDKTKENQISVTFTKPTANHNPYRVNSKVKLTNKMISRSSSDNNCEVGPPTWAPEGSVKVSGVKISFDGTGNTAGEDPSVPGNGGSFTPPSKPHTPPQTVHTGSSAGETVNATPTTPIPPTYADGSDATLNDIDWYDDDPVGGLPTPDPHASQRSQNLTVSAVVESKLKGTAIEIVVAQTRIKAKATLQATLTTIP